MYVSACVFDVEGITRDMSVAMVTCPSLWLLLAPYFLVVAVQQHLDVLLMTHLATITKSCAKLNEVSAA